MTYVYTDPQGTPLAEADAQGNITARFDYAPDGSVATGVAPNGPGYTGHVNDPDTGLVYMQARYYDPVTARFLNVDPKTPAAGNAFNFNRYAYANNNPIINVDPDGRVVTSMNSVNNARLQAYINANAAGNFAFKGVQLVQLNSGGSFEGKSRYYADGLAAAIASPVNVIMDIAPTHTLETGQVVDVNAAAGGGITEPRSNGNVILTISGDANTSLKSTTGAVLPDAPKDILMHELVAHAIPMATSPDTGNGITNENKARAEIPGLGQRAADPNHVEGKTPAQIACGLLCAH